ncbi:MAG: cupin domain-containing protein [Methylovulum sp.]|nr:cupin domain-containing protein [Methylovulum sp.]
MQACILKANEDNEYYFEEGCFILELANSTADPDVSIARARVKPGVTTELHRLKGVVERYVMLAGEAQVEIGDLQPQRLSAGDVVVIPPSCAQRITNTGANDLLFLAICSPRFTKNVYETIA